MAIDGTIWLAGNTSLRRFESGREIGSITTNIDPPLSRIMGLWTSDETDTLYILDSGLGRVLAINKVTAEVLAQYQDERFKSGQGLYVDAGTIYVATDQELLSFSEQNR